MGWHILALVSWVAVGGLTSVNIIHHTLFHATADQTFDMNIVLIVGGTQTTHISTYAATQPYHTFLLFRMYCMPSETKLYNTLYFL